MKLIADKVSELDKAVTDGNKIVCFLGVEFEIRNQIIAQFAIENEWGLSQWTHLGFVQDVEIIDKDGQAEIVPIESAKVYDLEQAIKQIIPDLVNKEIFIFEVMSYKNITPNVLALLKDNLEDIKTQNGIIILNVCGDTDIYSGSLKDDFLAHEGIVDFLGLDSVELIHFDYPTFEERVDCIQEVLKLHQEIIISAEVENHDGTRETIQFAHDYDNIAWVENLAAATEGLSLTQTCMALTYSMVANRGVVDVDIVRSEAATIRPVNEGIDRVSEILFLERVLDIQDRNLENYIVEKNFIGYAYRFLFERLYSRWGLIHFITHTENHKAQILDDIFNLMQYAPASKRKPLIRYNVTTQKVEEILTFAEHKENNDLFEDLKKLLHDNNDILMPQQILKWYRETNNDGFILYMPGFIAKNLQDCAAIQFIAELDQLSYKNLITTHESEPVSRYLIGSGFGCFFLD